MRPGANTPRLLGMVIAIGGLAAALLITFERGAESTEAGQIGCANPYIIDGDTFRCAGLHIRLANIDAPEMPDHCRTGRHCTPGNPFKARDYLISITRGTVNCTPLKIDGYGRTVALCTVGEQDLSCAMVASKHAIQRYGILNCQK